MKSKICRTCTQEKPIGEFSALKKSNGIVVSYNCDCNICRAVFRREQSRHLKALAIEYKGGKCNDCNCITHQAAFEFHHLDPTTKANKDPTHFLKDAKKLTSSAKQELDKCILLCANCHRIRHFSDLI